MAKITKVATRDAGDDGKKLGPECIAGGNAECHTEEQAVSQKTPQLQSGEPNPR